MSTIVTKSKIGSIEDMVKAELSKLATRAEQAMQILECFKASKAEYKSASRQAMITCFAIGFLNRVQSVVQTRDIESAERFIRFHAHYLRLKGSTSANDDVSVAQATVASTLEDIIEAVLTDQPA